MDWRKHVTKNGRLKNDKGDEKMKTTKRLIGTLALVALLVSIGSVTAASQQASANVKSDDYSSGNYASAAPKTAVAANTCLLTRPASISVSPPRHPAVAAGDVRPGISGRTVLRGNGTVIAAGCGRALLAGTGIIRVSCYENSTGVTCCKGCTVIVSSNAYVTAVGSWENEILDNAVKYTGSGTLYISGADIKVDISGCCVKLLASGEGQVILMGHGWYRAFGWRRAPRPIGPIPVPVPKENLRPIPKPEAPETPVWENLA